MVEVGDTPPLPPFSLPATRERIIQSPLERIVYPSLSGKVPGLVISE